MVDHILQNFFYEKLHDYCCYCGLIGHDLESCKLIARIQGKINCIEDVIMRKDLSNIIHPIFCQNLKFFPKSAKDWHNNKYLLGSTE